MTIIPWIILICWATFLLYWIISSFGIKRDIRRTNWGREWLIRIAVIIAIVIFIDSTSSFGNFARRGEFYGHPTTGALATIGAVLCIVGIAIAIWARVHLGRDWSPAPALKEGHELVTSGPYKFVRHPIYTGIILAVLGSTLTIPVWIIMFFVISGMFIWRVHVEEELMMKQFPDKYPEYKKRTWALIPFVW